MTERIILFALLIPLICCGEDALDYACRNEKSCVTRDKVYVEGDINYLENVYSKGICKPGVISCTTGREICEGEILPSNEVCNFKDDNCNGKIDEGLGFVIGQACNIAGGEVINNPPEQYGICKNGQISCSNNEVTCINITGPDVEVCNEIDDDCNALVDDNLTDIQYGICPTMDCLPQDPICTNGTYACANEGNLGEEVCDGLDNDCNGLIDDGEVFDDRFVYTAPVETLNVGECRAGYLECIDGVEVVLGMVLPEPEICDYLDQDCDGHIDESSNGIDPLSTGTTYSGPQGTEGIGICSAGRLVCEEGEYREVAEILPRQEDCTNGVDDDCDGETDELLGSVAPQSFLLIIDVSGSMSPFTNTLANAICNWANEGVLANSKFAIVLSGLSESPPTRILMDFGTPQEACNALLDPFDGDGMRYFSSGATEHMVLGALWGHSEPLSWAVGLNKQVVIFTDEPPQHPTLVDSVQIIDILITDCNDYNYQASVFTVSNSMYNINTWAYWERGALNCNGFIEELSIDETVMSERLKTRFQGNCF